eukprot:NODE_860_length_3458_cov_1.103007.p2 type:complete len:361 gc:universal NODE_860_length_3458_cov_1.103007:1898-2980(+)
MEIKRIRAFESCEMTNLTQVKLGTYSVLGTTNDFCMYISQDEQEEYYKVADMEVLMGVRDLEGSLDESDFLQFDEGLLIKRSMLQAMTENVEMKSKDILNFSLEDYNNGNARSYMCGLQNVTPIDPTIVRTFAIHESRKRSSDEEEIMRKKMKMGGNLTIDVNSPMEPNLPSLTNMLGTERRGSTHSSEDHNSRRRSLVQDELRNIAHLKQQMYKKRGLPPFGLNTSLKPELLTPSKSSPGMSSSMSNGTPVTGSPKPTVKQMFLPMFDKLCEYMDAQTSRIDVAMSHGRSSEKGLFEVRKQFKEFADNMNNNFLVELKKILVSVDSRLRKLERASLLQTPASDDMKFFAMRKNSVREQQ